MKRGLLTKSVRIDELMGGRLVKRWPVGGVGKTAMVCNVEEFSRGCERLGSEICEGGVFVKNFKQRLSPALDKKSAI